MWFDSLSTCLECGLEGTSQIYLICQWTYVREGIASNRKIKTTYSKNLQTNLQIDTQVNSEKSNY